MAVEVVKKGTPVPLAEGADMKSAKVFSALRKAIKSEGSALVQYRLHAQLMKSWGFLGLKHKFHAFFYEENTHQKQLMNRLLLLGGDVEPTDMVPETPKTGADPFELLQQALDAEYKAVEMYNELYEVAEDNGDNGTAYLFCEILRDEEDHVRWLQKQLRLYAKLGSSSYLATMIEEK